MRLSWAGWTLVILAAKPVAAQDTSRVAMVIGLHGPGVLVSTSSRTALRADGTVSGSGTGDSHSWNESIGVSGLFYLRNWDALRSYVGPRVAYGHSSSSGGASTTTWSGQLFFGTEYALAHRFGVFGELRVSYGRTWGNRIGIGNDIIPTPATTSWSTTDGVGLLFRF
jgi:hypothetical protein